MRICVIGGGAAGMFAAIMLARRGADVTLFEKNEKTGKKLYITGKGRCNLTNDCAPAEFLENVVRGEKFMRSAIYGFPPEKTIAFFEDLGLKLITERGNRVFPLSGKSSDVIKALSNELKRLNVDVRLNAEVTEIRRTCNERDSMLPETGINADARFNAEVIEVRRTCNERDSMLPETGINADARFNAEVTEVRRTCNERDSMLPETGINGDARFNAEVTEVRRTCNERDSMLPETGINGDARFNGSVNTDKNPGNYAVFTVKAGKESFGFDKVFVATGGMSYPSTGSTGDGYAFASSFGHDVTEPVQGLAPIIVNENVAALQGLSLKNVNLTAYGENGKTIKSVFGELMFTNRGLSGPAALTLSSYINRQKKVKLSLDLKPALDDDTLDKRILRDFGERGNQDLKNVTRALLPERLNLYVISAAGLKESKKVNAVTKEERLALIKTVKFLPFTVAGLAPFEEAVITSGGVSLKSLKPTFESKTVDGLYFIGETTDIDALTGGYNLQIAFASAAKAAGDATTEKPDKSNL